MHHCEEDSLKEITKDPPEKVCHRFVLYTVPFRSSVQHSGVPDQENRAAVNTMAEGRVRRVIPEDLSNVEFESSEEVEVVPTFDNMGLREDLLRGIYAYGK